MPYGNTLRKSDVAGGGNSEVRGPPIPNTRTVIGPNIRLLSTQQRLYM